MKLQIGTATNLSSRRSNKEGITHHSPEHSGTEPSVFAYLRGNFSVKHRRGDKSVLHPSYGKGVL